MLPLKGSIVAQRGRPSGLMSDRQATIQAYVGFDQIKDLHNDI